MKIVTAIVNPAKLDSVRDEIDAAGAHGVTVSEVKGFGRQKGHTEMYRGAEHEIKFNPKIKLEVAVEDSTVDQLMDAIQKAAFTGEFGDGKIFVTPLDKALRIRTKETGEAAL